MIKFGTRPVQQRLVQPRRDNGRDRCVSVGFALLIQRVAPHGNDSDAESTEDDQSEKDRSKNDQEFLHMRVKGEDACSETSDPEQATKVRFSSVIGASKKRVFFSEVSAALESCKSIQDSA